MNKSTIRNRLRHDIVMSVFAQESAEWATGRYSVAAVDKPWPESSPLLKLPAPVKFNTHHRRDKIERHCHGHYEMMYVYSGEIVHRFDDSTAHMREGDLLILAPGEHHSVDACTDNDIAVNIICDSDFVSTELSALLSACTPVVNLLSGASESGHILLPCRGSDVSKTIAEMLISEFLDPDISSMDQIKCCLAALINALYRVYGRNDGHVYQKGDGEKGDISYIFSYIQNHCATVSLGELSRVFGYDTFYLSKVIRKNLGATFIDLKHYFCIEEAKRLLRTTDKTVREISEHVGFNNMSYFYKIFAESCGSTPAEYRSKEA